MSFTKIPKFRRFVLQNFPFIEQDFDALTDYALICKVVEYLNKVISQTNANTEQVAELSEAFNNLENYVEHYFDNLDVQDEINNKLDQMAQDGSLARLIAPMLDSFKEEINGEIDELETSVNEQITAIDHKVDSVVSGNPIPVSSTDDMTDTDRTYLLTTDGYWYYYDGDSWERGGVYQSTDISDLSIGAEKTKFAKRSDNLVDIVNPDILNAYPGSSNTMSPSDNVRSLYIECEANTTYIVTRSVTTGRFGVCDSAVTPTTSSAYSNLTQNNTASAITHTTGATAEYLVVFYWNRNYSTNTAAEALEDLCILKGSENRGVIPSYLVEVKTDNLNDSAVTPVKTSFNKNSSNLFDKNNANVINGHPTGGTIHGSGGVRSIYIPCEGSTSYVVKKMVSSRFAVYTTTSLPANNVAYLDDEVDNDATQIKITTNASANYLCVFFYNSNYDSATPEQIMATLVIAKGREDITEYIPYGKIIKVATDNIDDGAVTEIKLSSNVKSALTMTGSLASRNGIYGVQYDITNTSSACTRIGNAVGLHNDYIVGDTYQLNGGTNDFDNIFPWCDIRRCNVKVSTDGTKSVVYEGETGFALDGSNGDVMVEIPKFYSYRERVGNTETIAISGERKSGFVCEPAFVVNGKELEHIYVGCYNQAPAYSGSHSYSGAYPVGNKTIAENIAELATSNMQSYDFSVYLMLQKLMTIEFADRAVHNYMGGLTRLPYWTASTTNVIDGFGTNYITFQEGVGQGTMDSFWVGERIRVGGTSENDMTNVREITNITKSGTQITVTYNGADMSANLHVGDGVGCYAQKNGLCDDLTYHTGRTDFTTLDTSIANYVNPMRYRYIENIFGNIWEQLAGLRVKGLQPYFSFEPNVNSAISSGDYQTIGSGLPLQNMYPSSNQGWIIGESYYQNNRLINLPSSCGVTGGKDKYFAGTFYSKDVTGVEYEAVAGGGWDTYYWANINTLRVWEQVGTHSNLYGNRPIYRG